MNGDRTLIRARQAWLPTGLTPDVTVELEGRHILDVRPARAGDGPALDGLVLPGLINAHTHVELSHVSLGPPPGSFLGWLGDLMRNPPPTDRGAALRAGAEELATAGTAWVGDVSNLGDTAATLAAAGLSGVVHHELLGFDRATLTARLAQVAAFDGQRATPFTTRPAPHALFSTHPELVRAALRAGPADLPASLHVGESEHEAQLLLTGDGPHAELLDRLGRDWRWWTAPGCSPLTWLDRLGVLGPRVLLVHGVRLSPEDRQLAAARGARLCVCARSNLHIGGLLPDVAAWLRVGVPVCLGTDSRASSPDLDLLGELPALAAGCPDVAPETWLALATHAGARAAGAIGFGAITPGAAPGLLHLPGVTSPSALLRGAPGERRWLVRPSTGGL